MSNNLFPSLHGLSWSLKKTPTFKTLLQPSILPGYETRVKLSDDVLFNFELEFTLLRKGYNGYDEMSQLEGFFMQQRGSYDSFLLDVGAITKDQAESVVIDQKLTVDGNNCAPLIRMKPFTSVTEAIYELALNDDGTTTSPTIKEDGAALVQAVGSPLVGDYTLYTPAQTATGVLNANGISYSGYVVKFLSPAAGLITADFGWLYRVRFAQDTQDFDMFYLNLWHAQSVQLVGCRA